MKRLHERISASRTPIVVAMMIITALHHVFSGLAGAGWHLSSEIVVYGVGIPVVAWVLLGWLAQQVAAAECAQQLEAEAAADLARRNHQIERLYNAVRQLAGARRLEDISVTLLELSCSITGAGSGALVLQSDAAKRPVAVGCGEYGALMRDTALVHFSTEPCLTCPTVPRCPLPDGTRCLPITAGPEILGILRLSEPEWDPVTQQSLNTLLAEMAATWTARRAEERALAALDRTAHDLHGRATPDTVLTRFVSLACQAVGAEAATIYRIDQNGSMEIAAGDALLPPPQDEIELARSEVVWSGQDGHRLYAKAGERGLIALTFGTRRKGTHHDSNLLRVLAGQAALLLGVTETMDDLVASERSRLAAELHDSIAQHLAYLNLLAFRSLNLHREGKFEDATATAEALAAATLDAYEETRQTIDGLRVHLRPNESVKTYLFRVLTPIQERSDAKLELTICEDLELPRHALEEVARVTHEATLNAVHHGKADRIEISLLSAGNRMELKIRDNGCGLESDEPAQRGHHGLDIMRERFAAIGGELVMYNRAGSGTEVQGWLSLADLDHAGKRHRSLVET